MAQPRKVMSDPDLITYSKDHVLYEIAMLVQVGGLMMTCSFQGAAAELTQNAFVESFAIHVRNLVDFLYPGTNIKGDDVLADDYFPNGKRPSTFPALPHTLKVARERAHKQVSHLTTGRLGANDPGKGWTVPALVTETLKILVEFAKQASPERLDQSVREYVLRAVVSPQSALTSEP
jgi:hypothetical protein